MPNQWSIKILDAPGNTVAFWPWVPGANPGDPLFALPTDVVTWNNTSAHTVKLVPVDPKGPFITDPILSGKVSAPMFSVPTAGIQYQTSDGKTRHSIVIGIQPPPSV